MRRVVEKGKTLLVDGPACVSLLSGRVSVLGAPMRVGEKTVIREGKRVPFEVKRRATFDLMLGENSSIMEVDGDTIPASWKDASKEVLSQRGPVTVMVLGGIDMGKTSFCTYLANRALKARRKVAVVDADLGQSDIGPPSTIGLGCVESPIKDLFEARMEVAYFVGVTSPGGAVEKILEGAAKLREKAFEVGANFLIVNTDGWVEGEDAVKYKTRLAEVISPNFVVGIQRQGELTPILEALKELRILSISPPLAVRKRDRSRRKVLRELSYRRYLKGAKVRSFPISWVNIKGLPIGGVLRTDSRRSQEIRDLLGTEILYYNEAPDRLLVVVRRGRRISADCIRKAEEVLGKPVKVIREGDEAGLLVGLLDPHENFLGIGVLEGIDYWRKTIKVLTPATERVATICVGRIRLDEQGREIGIASQLKGLET